MAADSPGSTAPAPTVPAPSLTLGVGKKSKAPAAPVTRTQPLLNPLKPEKPESSFLLTFIRAAITIPIVLIWIIVGLYIWIPLVFRRTVSYISAVVASAITRDTDSVVSTGINLEHSVSFFFDGFVLIAHSLGMTGRHLDEQSDRGILRAKEEFLISTIIWIFFAMIWMLVLLIMEI